MRNLAIGLVALIVLLVILAYCEGHPTSAVTI
jgi:hypothetical protein